MTDRQLTTRGERRRGELLNSATRLFADAGYHATSVSDIVEDVGVGKGVFYWYFESKEQLFTQILQSALRELRSEQRVAVAQVEDPLDQIAAAIEISILWSAAHEDLSRLIEFAATDAQFAPLIHRGRELLARDATAPIRRAMRAGSIPEGDPDTLAVAILGVSASLLDVFVYRQRGEPTAVAARAAMFCLRGLGASTQLDERFS